MKKFYFKLLTISLLMFCGFSLVACSDDSPKETENIVTEEELPQAAKDFLYKYFHGYEIIKITKDEEADITFYQVDLQDGYEVIFNSKGYWQQVDAPYGKTIPTGFIPEPILQTLDYQYNGYGIAEINTSGQNYHLVLSNNQGGDSIELVFNQSGEIIPGNQ